MQFRNITKFSVRIVDRSTYIWSSQANTNVEDGIQISDATTLVRCQSACIKNDNCTGIDWVPAAAASERCWLSGPWSGRRNNGTTSGVTHYDLIRSFGQILSLKQ